MEKDVRLEKTDEEDRDQHLPSESPKMFGLTPTTILTDDKRLFLAMATYGHPTRP